MKLVKGSGSPTEGACLLSAVAWYAGEKDWTDAPECVCPMVRTIGIALNDALPSNAERERICGPLIFRVMGTRTDDADVLRERRRVLVQFAIEQARSVLHYVPSGEQRPRKAIEVAENWLATESAAAAAAAAAAPATAAAAGAAYSAAAAYAAYAAAAAYAAYAAAAAYAYAAAADAAAYAAYAAAAAYAAYAADAADAADAAERRTRRVTSLRDLMERVLAIGDQTPVEQVRRIEDIPAYAEGRR